MKLSKEHLVLLSLAVAGLATQIAALRDWSEALTPQFVGGSLLAMTATVRAFFTDKAGRA